MKKILAVLALSAMTFAGAQAAEMSAVDTDANGSVSMEEAKAAMPEMTDEQFTAADADGDGSLNEEEFAAISQ